MRSAAGGGLIAVDPGAAGLGTDADLDDADPGDLGDLGPDDADLQAVLAEEDLGEAGLGEVGDLAGDVDGPETPDGPGYPEGSQPGQPSADANAVGPGGAGARVVKLSPDGGGEDEEIFVFGDDDDDLPAAQVAVAGASADPVKDYLRQIGKVPLLNAEQEVELAKRIEAGLFRRGEAGRAPLEPVHRRADRPGVDRRGRATPQGPPAGGEPAPGGLAGQAVHRAGHAVPGPDPGGQPGADPGGGEVRLHQGLPDGPNPGQAPANRAVGRRLAPRRRQRVVDYLLDV